MINNFLEIWYWTLMLGVFAGIAVYFVFDLVRDLWIFLKKRRSDDSEGF